MQYTFTVTEELEASLRSAVFSRADKEGAAYLLCGVSRTAAEIRLLARQVIPVADAHYRVRERHRLSIASDSYVPIAKRASEHGEAILFVHSHPIEVPDFSAQDDREDPKLMQYFTGRAPDLPHGCLVLSGVDHFAGRVREGGTWVPISRRRIVGRRILITDSPGLAGAIPHFFDRQVNAFGPDIQHLLARLHIGVVGAGGTGSAVVEQLCRLGVGTITVFDGDVLTDSNTSRVYGSTASVHGVNKADLQRAHLERIGLGTVIHSVAHPITHEDVARKLRVCDVVFGCTDKAAPRGILVRLALRYLIPVFDMAVKIRADQGLIEGIFGRITTLIPGEACLFCRGRTTPERIRAESLPPQQREREVQEDYIDELETDEPAVITFTTAVAAQAVSEFLHRLTGFMGEETRSSEVLMFFHQRTVRTNRHPPSSDCQCMLKHKWGRGDSRSFLELTWPAPH